jgi:glycine cleavage system P protein (glycine dehydrogenase) subunit 1
MFIPHTESERGEMLKELGIHSLDELFRDVPAKYRFPKLDLPEALSEMEAFSMAQAISQSNESTEDLVCFLGAGAYHHYIPAVVDAILSRGEFFTAYTPYQPEISQGTLQAVFEYQSLIAALTGMDVSNASHYDGATACAEAGVLAYHHFFGKRPRIVVAPSVHPHYRETMRTYLQGYGEIEILGDEADQDPFRTPESLIPLINQETSLVLVQYPDFFGRIFDLTNLANAVHEKGALLAVAINPIALGLLKPPSEFGADIVVGEGQPLGIPLSFGGPYLGLFATRKELVRKLAGRLVGESVDQQGRKGYVLTLTAREQHIRREKATSNICTNQGLMALAASVYLSALGKQGLKTVANLCYQKAHYAAARIAQVPGFAILDDQPFFHEFIVHCPESVEDLNLHLLDHGILGGYDLGCEYPGLKNHMLVAVTELVDKEDIDILCEVLGEVHHD